VTRFAVGIDLGTTHCALAFSATDAGDVAGAPPEVMAVTQLVSRGLVESPPLLPSFLYFAHESEGPQALPWDGGRTFVAGEYARARGIDAPSRVIASAKSWLSHPTVDRRAGFLPIGAPDDVEVISPVEASWRYLEHLAEAFDARFGGGDAALAKQDVVVTVPASFDAAARELTVEAAIAAGIEKLTLLEEPQAAVYAWTLARGDAWRREVKPGDVVLVVDIGGGTTDLSAIVVVEKDGALELVRVAVGDHILLGGDNMDLALVHLLRHKLEREGTVLDRTQQAALVHACRQAKEVLFGDTSLEAAPIVVAGRGSNLLGGNVRTEITREELTRIIVDGFFPIVAADSRPTTRARSGLTHLGLPYASDPAVTRHLAAFLTRQAGALAKVDVARHGDGRDGRAPRLLHPTAVLFNGGVMKADRVRERLVDTLNVWLGADGAGPVRVLEGADLDLAVARGACAYALARRGKGLRIRGGTARAYYVGIESAAPAVPGVEPPVSAMCVAPFGMEEGTEAKLPEHELAVVVGEPVSFRFYGSSVRRDDVAGAVLEAWRSDELEELPPMEVTLPAEGRTDGDVVPVRLRSQVTEVGTLLLEAEPLQPLKEGERWRVELSVRGDTDEVDVSPEPPDVAGLDAGDQD
jgi:Hsp70 protein